MRRRLFDFYHRVLARHAARLPAGLRAEVSGLLYRVSRHPDFGFAHARHLVQHGQHARATKLYGQADSDLQDPLFAAQVTPDPTPADTPAPGVFQVQLGYLGLRLSGFVRHKPGRPEPEQVSLTLEGVTLRHETLRFQNGVARFRCRISRPVLETFPKQAQLTAQVTTTAAQPSAPIPSAPVLPSPGGGQGWCLALPHATGGIAEAIAHHGPLEKKGHLRPDPETLALRQAGYLRLYQSLQKIFAEVFDRPLVILYGTLLGQVRAGDFIPGDDDFDVGYPSRATTPKAVRTEAIEIMSTLAARGFVIVLNETGRPFRIRAADGPVWCHLDNRPIYCPGDGHVWLHKHARLPLPLADFETPETARLRDASVLRPRNPDAFLAAYYGPHWRIPDPGYSNAAKPIPREITKGLARICLSTAEQRMLAQRYPGKIIPEKLQPLYPLDAYAKHVGF